MNAVRQMAETLAFDAFLEVANRRAAGRRIYDPYSLATRPIPSDLQIFLHPQAISAESARRITAGVVE